MDEHKPATPELTLSLPLGDLLSFGTQLRADMTPEALLSEVAETIHRTTGCPHVYIRLRHPDTDAMEAVAFVGIDEALAARLRAHPVVPAFYQSLLQLDFRIGSSFLIPAEHEKALAHELDDLGSVDDLDSATHIFQKTAMLLVPICSRDEHVLGLIYITLPVYLRALVLPNIQVLEAIARQAGLTLENLRLADRSARLLAREQLLTRLGRQVSASLDLETILAHTLARLAESFQRSSITLLDDRGRSVLVARSNPQGQMIDAASDTLAEPMAARVAWHGVPYFSNDSTTSTSDEVVGQPVTHLQPDAAGQGQHSAIAVPLRSGGQVIGTLNVGHDQPGAFSYDDVDLLEAIAAQVGGPIASAQLYRESRHLAEQVQRRADQLTVLTSLARIVTATQNMQHMLAEVTDRIRRGFNYSHVELYLLDEGTSELVLWAYAGGEPHAPQRSEGLAGRRQSIRLGIMGRAVRTRTTQQIDDVQRDSDYYAAKAGTRSELCVPIVAGGRVLGLINLESAQVAAFTTEDVTVLDTAADILAGAIENARLNRRAQEAAVLEERNRLARELHDSVTQQLFSITLTAQAARAHLEKNPPRAAAQLERLQETAVAALTEMRALIYQLRPPALKDQGLVTALQQHIATLSKREGLRIELSVTGDERLASGFEQALYRIMQEALNNIVKHAGASRVRVMLEFGTMQVQLRVSDNGRGFDLNAPDTRDGRHLGLISMRERAAEIGGTLTLNSTPGSGTDITVSVPRTEA